MTDYTNFAEAARAVVDPGTSEADLAVIAEHQPGLWAQIAGHPNAYPALLAWLDSVGDSTVKAAIAARHPNGVPGQFAVGAPVPPPPPQRQEYGAPTQVWTPTESWSAPLAQPTQAYPATPQAYPAPRPQPPQKPAGPFLKSPKGIATIAGGGVVIIGLVIVLLLNFLVWRPEGSAESQFNAALATFQQTQADLVTALDAAQTTANSFTADSLEDPTTLDTLNAAILAATPNATANPPQMATTTDQIKQQTTDMQTTTQAMSDQTDALNQGTLGVQASGLLWAKSALTLAIAEAKNTYTQYSYTQDQDSLAALQDQITAAQTALDSLDSVDPNTVAQVVSDAQTALDAAMTAVVNSAPVHCGDVSLPAGVDAMACGDIPDDAISLPGVPNWGAMFETPSHNIGCYPTDNGVICEVSTHSWKTPSDLMNACHQDMPQDPGMCDGSILSIRTDGTVGIVAHGDVPQWQAAKMEGAQVPVLNYGKSIDYTPVACLSANDGLTCWNIYTHHGFKVSASKLTYW